MKFSICDESATSSSSSEDDVLPILPETSSGELSTIEESHLEHETDSESSGSASSNYLSSLIDGSMSSLSSCTSNHLGDVHSKHNAANGEMNQYQELKHESDPKERVHTCNNATLGNVSSQCLLVIPEDDRNENSTISPNQVRLPLKF